jgi:hypothetical protein
LRGAFEFDLAGARNGSTSCMACRNNSSSVGLSSLPGMSISAFRKMR